MSEFIFNWALAYIAVLVITVIVFIVVLLSVVGYVANQKGRSAGSWVLIAIITTPVFALLALIALPNIKRSEY